MADLDLDVDPNLDQHHLHVQLLKHQVANGNLIHRNHNPNLADVHQIPNLDQKILIQIPRENKLYVIMNIETTITIVEISL
eukprot:CAMPEP_0201576556 /NCGR_PEP_ID=MMETSP0190_2-20130828/22441_1 /ASSEMBLY_ACC=CAM_ASM_000263 /TAXON_ID=37353 /ORGANISM="Rosalina sp." /LENGTH=80 /DNA_ID=CAMNT_0048007539 /DNA_START=781 /DNA_END=1023 /DNA_ORIENTATION=+